MISDMIVSSSNACLNLYYGTEKEKEEKGSTFLASLFQHIKTCVMGWQLIFCVICTYECTSICSWLLVQVNNVLHQRLLVVLIFLGLLHTCLLLFPQHSSSQVCSECWTWPGVGASLYHASSGSQSRGDHPQCLGRCPLGGWLNSSALHSYAPTKSAIVV